MRFMLFLFASLWMLLLRCYDGIRSVVVFVLCDACLGSVRSVEMDVGIRG
jgi:hypothetical protein